MYNTPMHAKPSGMTAFTILWAGQIVSLLGSAMTWFAFTIWVWQKTGEATALAMISFFGFLPTVLFTPIAGALVDRWNRKWVLALSDMATAIATLAALILYTTGNLQIWHVYVIGILAGFFTAFQYPAYVAAVTTMVPRAQFARAEGMIGVAQAISTIFGPMLAAVLLGFVDLSVIMTIDLVSFVAAFATLVWVNVPQPAVSETGAQSRGKLWQETLFGFGYIRKRKSLVAMTGLFMAANFFIAIGATLLAPMILSHTQNSEGALATVQSVGAVGGMVGGTILSMWGGPKKRIHGILLGGAGACLLGVVWLGASSVPLFWAVGSFFFSFFEPFVEGNNLAIWQSKVEADVQGRVLSARHLMVQIPYMLGMVACGPIAEKIVEPLLRGRAHSLLSYQPLSLSLTLGLAGLFGAIIFLAGYAFREVREVESILPDMNE